jgi:hypothetical protein
MPDWVAEALRIHEARYEALVCTLPWEKPDGKLRTHNVLFRPRAASDGTATDQGAGA